MPRWYAARSCVGSVERAVQDVTRLVQQFDLRAALPLVRFEKRPKRSFYMFLAIESEQPGELPPSMASLKAHPVLSGLMPGAGASVHPFTLDEIARMVSGEVSVENYARRLHLRAADPPEFMDPFAGGEQRPGDDVEAIADRTDRFDRLMLWLSATGEGGRASFLGACRALGLAADGAEAGRILRRLRLLGHLESSPDGERWSVAPAVLAQVEGYGAGSAFVLCGERDPRLLAAIARAAEVERAPQPGGAGPARLTVQTDDVAHLSAEMAAAWPADTPRIDRPAKRLAELLPPIARWPAMLTALPGVTPAMYELRRYDGEAFVPAAFSGAPGCYELWPRDVRSTQPGARPAHTLYFEAASQQWLRGDWYGLRYLARVAGGLARPARYQLHSGRMQLWADARPPELYERALTLASGRLPAWNEGWLEYSGIEPDVANLLAAKLELDLTMA